LTAKKFEAAVKNEVRVSVSIDGTEKTNDLIRGKGAYADAVSAIEKLSREGLLNCLVYTFAKINESTTNVNERDITHVLDLAAKYGARWVIFTASSPIVKIKTLLKQIHHLNNMNGPGTNFMIYSMPIKENRKSMFIAHSLRVWRNREDYQILTVGITISFLVDAFLANL
jgi:sulfatase maturation enzyme AslB (radical SAM superfamily)